MMLDETLEKELEALDVECKRRKSARPPEPFAAWKMREQMEAIKRFNVRQSIGATPPAPSGD